MPFELETTMKFAIPLACLAALAWGLAPTGFEFEVDALDNLLDGAARIFKRDDGALNTIEQILIQTNKSGILWDLVDGIAASNLLIDNIANLAVSVLNGNTSAIEGLGVKIELNTLDLVATVMQSGIITLVADGLLLNEANRQKLAGVLGNSLENDVWISKLLQGLGDGDEPLVDYIANTIKYTKSKNPRHQDQLRQRVLSLERRANTEGLAQLFFGNLINTVLQSQLVSGSLSDVLVALNDTGVGVDMVVQLLDHTGLLYAIGLAVVSKLYNSGALSGIDLNTPYQKAKREHTLLDGLQALLTNPTYAPGIAALFKQLDDSGVYHEVKLNLYGP